ncbi:response regulator transcription factor [Sphingomonas sp. S1-29]|uniref:response regulator transcription factor n=1 Tax=Sphingomonas sp. S1-29 TaxID=2991074 RepID=UPI0022406AD5|nr:response regulator transcription factor [Sphingomonas sp. S1-29]UZK70802.1 response regulator transcription factor [Sphingomonas sp. S1-29]
MARIIVAEDDEILGEIACDVLVAYGHAAGLVQDGAEALQIVKTRRPDLLVLDCNLPGMSGVTVLRELRNMPAFCDLPIMMLTGRRGAQDEELARFAGADDYMKKPFDPDEFVFRVEELLTRKQKASPPKRA